MSIDISYGLAKDYARAVEDVSDLKLADVNNSETQESVFIKGRELYNDFQEVMLRYNEVLVRDIENITGIAQCIEIADSVTAIDLVGNTKKI